MLKAKWIDEADLSLLAAEGLLRPYFAEVVRDGDGWRTWAGCPTWGSRAVVTRHATRQVAKAMAEIFLERGGVRVRA